MFLSKGTKALVIKEIKEHIYGFLCFIFIMGSAKTLIEYLAAESLFSGHASYLDVHMACYLIVPIYTLYLGVSTFAYEKDKGTITYLSSLPMKKTTLWSIKTLVASGFCLLAIASLPFFINDSSSFVPDGSLIHILNQSSVLIVPALLTVIFAFVIGLTTSVLFNTVGTAMFTGIAAGIGTIVAIPALDLLEPMDFILSCLIGGFLVVSIYISPGRAVKPKKTVYKKFALSGATILVLLYFGLFGWHAVTNLTPRFLRINDFQTSKFGPVFRVTGQSLYGGGPVRPYSLYRGNLVWHKRLNNHSFFAPSIDEDNVLLLDYTNHWGFFQLSQRLALYGKDGELRFKGPEGKYSSPRWSNDGTKLAYLFMERRAFAFGKRKFWNLYVLDLKTTNNRKIEFTEHDFYMKPELIGWNDRNELLLSSSKSMIVELDSKKGDVLPNSIISIDLQGKVTKKYDSFIPYGGFNVEGTDNDGTFYIEYDTFDKREIVAWKDGKSQVLCNLPNGWNIQSISNDGRWLAMSWSDFGGDMPEGPRPYNYFETLISKQVISVVDTTKLQKTVGNDSPSLSSDELKDKTLVSFSSTFFNSQNKVRNYHWKWSEQDKAFQYFVPSGTIAKDASTTSEAISGQKNEFRYYYPETKEQKTILTVEDVL